jgi:hypothetical protein
MAFGLILVVELSVLLTVLIGELEARGAMGSMT